MSSGLGNFVRWFNRLRKPRVLILTGPTGTGKTDLSISLAKKLNGEIISADSVQVYRGLDVGSSKISKERMNGIPHHLIDIIDPVEDFSAGRFYHEARAVTEDIVSRGRTPIVVGGTGFYLKWFVHGSAKTGASTAQSRQMATDCLEKYWSEAKKKLGRDLDESERWDVSIEALRQAGDSPSADRISKERNNYYRLSRALEIVLQSEKQMEELAIDVGSPLDYDFKCFYLHRPRMEIYRRTEKRCEQMIRDGILEEAKRLLEMGLLPNQNCATRSIGYKQCMEFLQKIENKELELTDQSLLEFILDFKSVTRRLVKQQVTWFRSEPLYHWIDLSSGENVEDEIIRRFSKANFQKPSAEIGVLTKKEMADLKRYNPELHYYKTESDRLELMHRIRELCLEKTPVSL